MRSNLSAFSSEDESSPSAVTYTAIAEDRFVGSTANPTANEMPTMRMIPVNPQDAGDKGKGPLWKGKGKGYGKNKSKTEPNTGFQPYLTSLLAPNVMEVLSNHVRNQGDADGTRLDELLHIAHPLDHRIRRHLLMLYPSSADDESRFIDLPGFRPGDRYYMPDEYRNYLTNNASSSAAAPYEIRIEENDEEMRSEIDSNVGYPPLTPPSSDNESSTIWNAHPIGPQIQEITDRQLRMDRLEDFEDGEPTHELLRYGGMVLNSAALASLDMDPQLWVDAAIYNLHVQVPNNFPMDEVVSLDGNASFIPVSYAVDECTLIFRECRIMYRSLAPEERARFSRVRLAVSNRPALLNAYRELRRRLSVASAI